MKLNKPKGIIVSFTIVVLQSSTKKLPLEFSEENEKIQLKKRVKKKSLVRLDCSGISFS